MVGTLKQRDKTAHCSLKGRFAPKSKFLDFLIAALTEFLNLSLPQLQMCKIKGRRSKTELLKTGSDNPDKVRRFL